MRPFFVVTPAANEAAADATADTTAAGTASAAKVVDWRRGNSTKIGTQVEEEEVADDFEVPPGNEKRGLKLFKRHCAQCHSIYPDGRHRIAGNTSWGPTMWNVYWRTAGIEKGGSTFQVSKHMTDAGIVWNDANLMRYMRNPMRFTDGRIGMNFFGITNFQDRVDIIHYLKTLTYEHPRGKKILAELERSGAPVT